MLSARSANHNASSEAIDQRLSVRREPAGRVTGPPHFVGVGAQRCGTTWWHRQITVHPGVPYRGGLHFKEVHFFDSLEGVAPGPEHAERTRGTSSVPRRGA